MIEDTLKDTERRMGSSIESMTRELAGVRTGRASPALLEHVMVDYYGAATPLNQLASVAAPEARLLTVQAWDKQAVRSIEKAILKSDLGLNPSSDGTLIRLPIPQLTEERRKDLVKLVRRRVEEGKVAIRNVRRDGVEQLRALEKSKDISQDDQHRAQDQLQKQTDSFVAQAEKLGVQKEAELMEV